MEKIAKNDEAFFISLERKMPPEGTFTFLDLQKSVSPYLVQAYGKIAK